ncbi:hypothetical protein WJX74_002018 [Apatococcus lobatus]|uniref:Uncharacterized protein n=1 Tax=Apatococcus lobatus TaxID=904363 RepID=A0AAW1Q8U7_9CHLO
MANVEVLPPKQGDWARSPVCGSPVSVLDPICPAVYQAPVKLFGKSCISYMGHPSGRDVARLYMLIRRMTTSLLGQEAEGDSFPGFRESFVLAFEELFAQAARPDKATALAELGETLLLLLERVSDGDVNGLVAGYRDGAWGGIASPSRAALAEENEVLRSHLANLGWSHEMMETTNVRTSRSGNATTLASRLSTPSQVIDVKDSASSIKMPAEAAPVPESAAAAEAFIQSAKAASRASETAEPSAPPMSTSQPQSPPRRISSGTIPAIITPTKNPDLSPLYAYASPEHRRQLLLTAKQRSGALATDAPQELGSGVQLAGDLPPVQPTQRQANRRGSQGMGAGAGYPSPRKSSSQPSLGSLQGGMGSPGHVARQIGIFGSAGLNSKALGLPLTIDDDVTDSMGGGGLIPAVHATPAGRPAARGKVLSPIEATMAVSGGRSASGSLMGNWSEAPVPNALPIPSPHTSTSRLGLVNTAVAARSAFVGNDKAVEEGIDVSQALSTISEIATRISESSGVAPDQVLIRAESSFIPAAIRSAAAAQADQDQHEDHDQNQIVQHEDDYQEKDIQHEGDKYIKMTDGIKPDAADEDEDEGEDAASDGHGDSSGEEDSASEGAQSLFQYEGRGSPAWDMRSSAAATSVHESNPHPASQPLAATEASDSDDSDFLDAASAAGSQSLGFSTPSSFLTAASSAAHSEDLGEALSRPLSGRSMDASAKINGPLFTGLTGESLSWPLAPFKFGNHKASALFCQIIPPDLSVGDWVLELCAQAGPLMAKASGPFKVLGFKADGNVAVLSTGESQFRAQAAFERSRFVDRKLLADEI